MNDYARVLRNTKIEDLIDAQFSENPADNFYIRFGKRVLDLVAVIVMALPVLLILLPLALVVATDGKSPIYLQKRVGRNGRVFNMWKLRTMVPDAENILKTYLESDPEAREEWERVQKLKHDPRITPFGKFLRKTSMDELPQLFNVLIGEMSLVGPRPMMISQKALYPGTAYYAMRPGITGFWQTSVRNDCSFSDRASYDTRYWHAKSLATDLQILLKTVNVVIKGTGY